jgi:microcystin-dependent protein
VIELYGGTSWEQIVDRFLYGSDNAGSTGGEVTHTLTINEMPSHTHIQNQHRHSYTAKEIRYEVPGSGGNSKLDIGATSYTSYATATNQNTGGGQAHNNMPPYITCYIWRRTA